MWEVITSQGHRARDIQHESDALRAVHSLGLTTLIAPYRYLVSDHRGRRFVISRAPGAVSRFSATTACVFWSDDSMTLSQRPLFISFIIDSC